MKNIKNYKMKDINFGANFESAQLYSTIIVVLGQKRNENFSWVDWRQQKLIIELNKKVENCLIK